MRFQVTVLIIDVFDQNGNVMPKDLYRNLQSPLKNSLNTKIGSRTWKIHDKEAIKMLCECDHDESYESGFFRINKLKWNIKLYPNGRQLTQFEVGDVLVQIQLEELVKPMIGLSFACASINER